jgi:hypothetical protein
VAICCSWTCVRDTSRKSQSSTMININAEHHFTLFSGITIMQLRSVTEESAPRADILVTVGHEGLPRLYGIED